MNIAVIGTGHVKGTLGRRWVEAGYAVIWGSREPQGDKARALLQAAGKNSCADTEASAAKAAEVVVLAVPYLAAQETIQKPGNLSGKVLIDPTNPLSPDPFSLRVCVPPSPTSPQRRPSFSLLTQH